MSSRLRLLLGLLGALLVLAPQPVRAQDDGADAASADAAEDDEAEEDDAGDADEESGDFARSGAYVRGAAQFVAWTSTRGFVGAPEVSWQPDLGVDVALGWRESERLAIEVEFEWVINHEDIGLGSWLLGVNGKFYFLEERIQPYLVLGAGAMWTEIPGATGFLDDWAFRNGLGVDYYLNDHWALTAESTFVWGVGDVWENYFVTASLGAMYRF